jgi:hypothetical protein
MILQIAGIILAITGYFANFFWLFLIGGFLCLILDISGFLSGKLNPTFPVILYIGGFIIVGNWTGILFGSVLGNLIEVITTLIGAPFFILKREKQFKKEEIDKNNVTKVEEFFKK